MVHSDKKPESSRPTLYVGVVGCGKMGQKHALNCASIEGARVVAVADIDRDKAEALAKQIRAEPYSDPEAMIKGGSLDAVIIATPPDVRQVPVAAALDSSLAIFVEKPLALNVGLAKEFCKSVAATSPVNAVGFHLRYSPLTQKMLQLIAGERITQVRTITTTSYYLQMDMPLWFLQREHSGGPLFEQSLHMLDTARYLVGEISHVFARGEHFIQPDLPSLDSEDTMVLAYRFSNGILGTHTDSCANLEFNWGIEVFGPGLRLYGDYARKHISGYLEKGKIDIDIPDTDLHKIEMERFVKAALGHHNGLILSDFADATRTLSVLTAADHSLKSCVWEEV